MKARGNRDHIALATKVMGGGGDTRNFVPANRCVIACVLSSRPPPAVGLDGCMWLSVCDTIRLGGRLVPAGLDYWKLSAQRPLHLQHSSLARYAQSVRNDIHPRAYVIRRDAY